MFVPEEKIREVIQGVVDNFLKPKFIELGMNASGTWLNSIEARTSINRGEIWGMDYTYYLAKGRKPGKRPPIQPLIQWAGLKLGLSGQQAVSAAFAIANKIAKDGTKYYPNGTDLLSILQSKEVNDYVIKEIGDYIRQETQLVILKKLKEAFV
ncbi:hypothetical protein [Paenimyroides ceti]